MELFEAVASNNIRLVKERIEKGDSAKWQNEYQVTSLHKICNPQGKKIDAHTCVEIMRLLLSLDSSRIDVNQKDRSGFTPLHLACRYSSREIVRLLLDDNRVDPNIFDTCNWTPFHYACNRYEIPIILEMAQRDRVDLNLSRVPYKLPIFQTCHKDRSEIFAFLWNHPRTKINEKTSLELLYVCIDHQSENSVKLLVKDERIDLNLKSNGRITPLLYSCSKGLKEAALSILTTHRPLDINDADGNGSTALFFCSFFGHHLVVERLLQFQDLKVNQANCNQSTPLYVACQNGRTKVVELLMRDSRVDPNLAQKLGVTPFFQACQQGHLDIVEKLLSDARVDISSSWRDRNWSPLMVACYKGKLDVVNAILSSDRKIDLSQCCNTDFLEVSIGDKVQDITKKSQENQETKEQILDCLQKFSDDPIKFAISYRKQRNIQEKTLEQKFIFACADGDLELAKTLIDSVVDAKLVVDGNGFDVLFLATFRNQSTVVNYLKSIL